MIAIQKILSIFDRPVFSSITLLQPFQSVGNLIYKSIPMENQSKQDADSIPVKVVVRVRPLIPMELEYGATDCVTVDEKTNAVFVNDRNFVFDTVFGPKCSQDCVYEESVRDLLASSFNGYNTTIFAYGQTGSGKTFTMGTSFEHSLEGEQEGILPRMIHDIFDKLNMDVEDSAENGYSYEIYASYTPFYENDM